MLTILSLVMTMVVGTIVPNVARASKGNQGSSHNNDKVSPDLRDKVRNNRNDETVKVILQLDGNMSGNLNALLRSNGVKVKKQFAAFNSFAVELPASVVESLSHFSEVSFVSVDSEVLSLGGHVAHTSGADNVRSIGTDGALDGNGVGIAIVDSGI